MHRPRIGIYNQNSAHAVKSMYSCITTLISALLITGTYHKTTVLNVNTNIMYDINIIILVILVLASLREFSTDEDSTNLRHHAHLSGERRILLIHYHRMI